MVRSIPGPARSPTGREEEGGARDKLGASLRSPCGGGLAEGEPPFLRHYARLLAMLTLSWTRPWGPLDSDDAETLSHGFCTRAVLPLPQGLLGRHVHLHSSAGPCE